MDSAHGRVLDDIAVIRSCWTDGINHAGGVCQMNTCTNVAGRPSLGAWVDYGLGTANQNLPSFVVLKRQQRPVVNGPRNWGSGFIPASHQGVRITRWRRADRKPELARRLFRRTRQHAKSSTCSTRSTAITPSAATEQRTRRAHPQLRTRVPHASRSAGSGRPRQEPEHIKERCTGSTKETESSAAIACSRAGWSSAASGSSSSTAAPAANGTPRQDRKEHPDLCRSMDKPVAGLLKDLKQRGLLDDTLVVWGGEFGRTPMSEKGDGRDHNPTGFTMWMAGGGVKGGQVIGATDDLGLYAVEDKLHVHDIHASILHLLGLDNMALTYDHNGRTPDD
jgi:hypothetical protein